MFTSSIFRKISALVVATTVAVFVFSHAAVAAQGDCSQPVSAGVNPVASDCLFILKAAVGLLTCTPQPCTCDPTGDGSTTASDALTFLKKSVGESITLLCPCGSISTTTTTTIPNDADCTNDGNCSGDDCVCSDCDDDFFCRDPDNCFDNGDCNTFTEGCVCADCMSHPECLDN